MKFNDHWWCFVFFLVAGATVYVHGRGARPTLSQCVISDSENVGIFVTDGAQVGNTCTVMFKPSNLDMTDVKFFKMGSWLVHYITGLRPLMVWDCYLPIAWVACENSRFSSLLAVWDVSPADTSAPEQKKSIVIIPTCLLCQMQAKSSGTEFLRSNPSSDRSSFCLFNLLLFWCSLCRRLVAF